MIRMRVRLIYNFADVALFFRTMQSCRLLYQSDWYHEGRGVPLTSKPDIDQENGAEVIPFRTYPFAFMARRHRSRKLTQGYRTGMFENGTSPVSYFVTYNCADAAILRNALTI